MKKIALIIITLLSVNKALSQQFESFSFLEKEVDSVNLITIYYPSMNEMYELNSKNKNDYPRILTNTELKESNNESKRLDSIIRKENSPHKIDSCKLRKIEVKKVLIFLSNSAKGHALPYEYDIQLNFYKKGKIVQSATISSYTKNLVIRKKGCKKYIDEYEQEIDPCFYQGMVSNKLKKYLIKTLK
ncbi:MAG: hypothetical protein ACK5IC_10895, partial [Moheibacter sp.]